MRGIEPPKTQGPIVTPDGGIAGAPPVAQDQGQSGTDEVVIDGDHRLDVEVSARRVSVLWRIHPVSGSWTPGPIGVSLREAESPYTPPGLRFDWRPLFREWLLQSRAGGNGIPGQGPQKADKRPAPWQPDGADNRSFSGVLNQARRERGKSYGEIAAYLFWRVNSRLHLNTVKGDFGQGPKYIPMERLRGYARLFYLPLDQLIYLANLRFTEFTPEDWMGESYPLYIENSGDVDRLRYYKEMDPGHGTLGWEIFEFRKDPDSLEQRRVNSWYSEITKAEHHRNHLLAAGDVECNRQVPTLARLRQLAAQTGYPLERILRRYLYTYFGDSPSAIIPAGVKERLQRDHGKTSLEGLIRDIFGDQVIYFVIDHKSYELEKVLGFAHTQASPGELLFALRNTRLDFPTVNELAQQLGLSHQIFHVRELNQVGVTRTNLHAWIRLLNHFKAPIHWLGAFIDDPRVQVGSLGYALVTHADGNLLSVRAETGVSLTSLQKLMADPAQSGASAQYFKQLKEIVGDEVDLRAVYLQAQGGVRAFFPGTRGKSEDTELRLSTADLEAVFGRFNLQRLLVDYRMSGNISVNTLADRLGVARTMVKAYESHVQNIRDDRTLLKLAEILAEKYLAETLVRAGKVPPDTVFVSATADPSYAAHYKEKLRDAKRHVYLHFHPEILLLFPVYDAQARAFMKIDREGYRGWVQRKERARLVPNAPRDVTRLLFEHARVAGVNPLPVEVKALAQYLSTISEGRITPIQARKFVSPTEALPFSSMLELREVLPKVNLRRHKR